MEENIRSFLLAGENIQTFLLIIIALILGSLIAISYGASQHKKFVKVWLKELAGLITELNQSGLVVVETLIDIAMINANKEAALAIGMVKQQIEIGKNDVDFFSKLQNFMQEINDHNHTMVLNSHYAQVRDAVNDSIDLVKSYTKIGNLEDLPLMAVEIDAAKQQIEAAVSNLKGILYGPKSEP
ncbi:MAG: hypothetical protein WAV16_04015 [Candidatus Moraniibacteriota bacterium]